MIEIDGNHSPLIRWLESIDESYKALFDFSNWATICLRSDSKTRVYIIPSLANSVMYYFNNLDPTYMDSYIDEECYKDENGDLIAQDDLSADEYLLGIIEQDIDELDIKKITSISSEIVMQHKINESQIKKWSHPHAVIEKLHCHVCKSKGSLSSVKKCRCNTCLGKGYILNKDKKDVATCEKCKGLGSKTNTLTKECKECEGFGFKPKIHLIQHSDIRCPSKCELGYIQFGFDCLYSKIMCNTCKGSGERRFSSTIGEYQFTVGEWKSISIVKLKYFSLSPYEEYKVCIDLSKLNKIFREHSDCMLLKGLLLDKSGRVNKFSNHLHLIRGGVKFETTGIEFKATLHMGDPPRVDLTITPLHYCDTCLGSGYHGIWCPTCDRRLRSPDPLDIQAPKPGYFRLYRYVDGNTH